MKRIGTTILPVLLLVLIACPELLARNTATGQVLDENGQPISQVNIQSGGIEQSARTDDEGRFSVSLKSIEPTNLIFTHAGYIPRTVRVSRGEEMPVVVLKRQVYPMQGITVTAGRAIEKQSPVPFATVTSEDVDRDFDFGEVPELVELTPNLYSYADAGDGLGYSYLKIRGFDARRTPVYINGIPLNDPEDHALYFFDLPDFASTVDNIQVQRGVGNALYGDAAFAGSINMLTSPLSHDREVLMEQGYGGFLSDGKQVGIMRKSTVRFSTGLMENGWSLTGKWARQYSDGYRKESWYKGTSYFLSVGRLDPKMITTINIYGGPIKTHASWWGITRETMAVNRRTNPYTYDDESDNFNQPHFEFHNIFNLNDRVTLYNTLYYIRGTGYYEEYRYADWGARLYDYNLSDDSTIYSDLIRRKRGIKGQWGVNSQAEFCGADSRSLIGGSYYFFESEHWGEVIWAEEREPSFLSYNIPFRYCEHFGKIHNLSFFGSHTHHIAGRWTLSGALQMKYHHLNAHQTPMGIYSGHIYGVDWLFLSPRLGAAYAVNEKLSTFAGFAISSHVPNDDMLDDTDDPADRPRLEIIGEENGMTKYGDPLVKPERVYDFELGANYRSSNISFDVNLYWMEHRHAIVPDGGVNDDGFPTFSNAERAVHRGIETAWVWKVRPHLKIEGNYSINDNVVKEHSQPVYDYENGTVYFVDRSGAPVPQFPKYLANLAVEYDIGSTQLVYRLRSVGRQFPYFDGRYADRGGEPVDVSIAPYTVSSIKACLRLGSLLSGTDLTLEGRIDNLFNHKYETFGVYYRDKWTDQYYYWPGAERNWFVNLKLAVK